MTTDTLRAAPEAARLAQTWQESSQVMATRYVAQWRRMADASARIWGMRWLEDEEVRQGIERVAESAREVARTRVALTGAWLRAPLWLRGAEPSTGVPQRYGHLLAAQRDLTLACIDTLAGVQRAVMSLAEQAIAPGSAPEPATEAASPTEAERVDAGAFSVEAPSEAPPAMATGDRNGHHEIAHNGVESSPAAGGSAPAVSEPAAPPSLPIKGKINREGERIYHVPGQANYDRVEPDELFETEGQARAAGYRPSLR